MYYYHVHACTARGKVNCNLASVAENFSKLKAMTVTAESAVTQCTPSYSAISALIIHQFDLPGHTAEIIPPPPPPSFFLARMTGA